MNEKNIFNEQQKNKRFMKNLYIKINEDYYNM